jgi:predicted dehydrogenase
MIQSNPIPIAVIGLGHFGRFHAQKWAQTTGARLAVLVDQDLGRAQALADELGPGIDVSNSLSGLQGKVQAASVAVPTLHHYQVVSALLDMGIHVLVEKPLVANLDEADRLIAQAAKAGVVLQVGHQERFFFQRVPLGDRISVPLAMATRRCGVPSGRMMDCSVVLDLMIHDIDLCLSLIHAPITKVRALGDRLGQSLIERAAVRLDFADGSSADLFADRLAPARHRTLTLNSAKGTIEIDFLTRQARHAGHGEIALKPVPAAVEADTLLAETTAFLQAVRGQGPVVVDAIAGRRALDAALAIEHAMIETDLPPEGL